MSDKLTRDGGRSRKRYFCFVLCWFPCGSRNRAFLQGEINFFSPFVVCNRYYNERPILLSLIYISYGLPLLLTMLWIKPMGRYFFTEAPIGSYGEPL